VCQALPRSPTDATTQPMELRVARSHSTPAQVKGGCVCANEDMPHSTGVARDSCSSLQTKLMTAPTLTTFQHCTAHFINQPSQCVQVLHTSVITDSAAPPSKQHVLHHCILPTITSTSS
jgi:hypothetical protein